MVTHDSKNLDIHLDDFIKNNLLLGGAWGIIVMI